MKNKFYYAVVLMNPQGRECYTLKAYTTLQNARKFVEKEKDTVRMGFPFKEGQALRIYKMDKDTGTPSVIYLN